MSMIKRNILSFAYTYIYDIFRPAPSKEASKSGVNQFSNDGSFLNQFKQLKTDKKNVSKFKTFNKYKDKEREREKEKEKERDEKEKEKEKELSSDSGVNR